jgi:signal transduction histidine kinase
VQNVLGAAEMAAQSGLVRVLTHEIMNSLTPVTSLIRSAADLLASSEQDPDALAEARQAVEVAARRAEGMRRFVENYRSFERSPDIRKRRFSAVEWADEIARLSKADAVITGVQLDVSVPPGLWLDADPDLLAQVCINLLRNAAAAARSFSHTPQIGIVLQDLASDGFRIEVFDNGPGIAVDRRDDVFLPFYTTRPEGNGIGLSFARQVVIAHGGSITATTSRLGGASIVAVMP